MITQWIQVGADCIAVDDQNGVCGVIKWLDGEIVVQPIKTPQQGSQKVTGGRHTGINEAFIDMGRRSSNPIFKLSDSMKKIEEFKEKQRKSSVN